MARPALEIADIFRDHGSAWRQANAGHVSLGQLKVMFFLAGVVGKAHARQMEAATRTNWSKELERNRSKTLEAPSWLWSSVVSLIGSHEVAYLEHCRKYATQVPA